MLSQLSFTKPIAVTLLNNKLMTLDSESQFSLDPAREAYQGFG